MQKVRKNKLVRKDTTNRKRNDRIKLALRGSFAARQKSKKKVAM
jgi:hypothetical protein